MGLYNFQPRFVSMIESGAKTHTIRAPRRYPDRVGSTLHLYTGLRQPGARLLKRVTCTAVQKIMIIGDSFIDAVVIIDGQMLGDDECVALARSDGFSSFDEMLEFWSGRLPFEGQIIHWGGAR